MSHYSALRILIAVVWILSISACSPQLKISGLSKKSKGIPVLYKVPAMTHTVVIDASALRVSLYEGKNLIHRRITNEIPTNINNLLKKPIRFGKNAIDSTELNSETRKDQIENLMIEFNSLEEDRNRLASEKQTEKDSHKVDTVKIRTLKGKMESNAISIQRVQDALYQINLNSFMTRSDEEPSNLTIQSNGLTQTLVYADKPYTINPRLPWFGKSEFIIELNTDGTLKTTTNNSEGGGAEAVESVVSAIEALPLPFGKDKDEKLAALAPSEVDDTELVYITIENVGYRYTYARTINEPVNNTPFKRISDDVLPKNQFAEIYVDLDTAYIKELSKYYTVSQKPLPVPGNVTAPDSNKTKPLTVTKNTTWSVPVESQGVLQELLNKLK